MALHTWLLYVATVRVVTATPGPNMLLAMTHGMRFGVRKTLPTCAGMLVALGLIMLGSAVGLGAVLATSEKAFSLVKYAGAAYLVYLGIKTWRAEPVPPAAPGSAPQVPAGRFRTGFLVAMSNPKAFIFFSALFPQFMDAGVPEVPQLAILTATFYAFESSWQMVYATGGARLARWLSSPRRMRWVNRLAGGAFVVAGLALTTASRHG
ncbi:MAG: LysE family translocator [Myxococcales bacterium]|nr:LysE family translocator [Myxococcales bacterium]